jgi:outer membrane autotransporter protein
LQSAWGTAVIGRALSQSVRFNNFHFRSCDLPSVLSAIRGCALCTVAVIATALSAGQSAAADVDITTDTATVNLDTFTGTTARVFPGVTVSSGISATTQPWSVTNDGTVNGGNTVTLQQGGTWLNSSGANVTGSLTAIAFGYKPVGLPPAGGPGYLDNYGTITGGSGEGVTMWLGGEVVNRQGATISTPTGLNAVSVGQGTFRTLTNSGTISATRTTGFSTGVLMQGGPSTFTNNASGTIFGDYNGLYGSATALFTFNNAGSITSRRGAAVEALAGGTFINSGTIGSTNSHGILIRNNSNADITNSGTISGAVNAISFAATGGTATAATHTLRLDTGSVLNGNVLGGSNTDNLVLLGSGTESIAKFLNFENLTMQGTDWTLTGSGTFSATATVQGGLLQVNGQLTSPNVTVQSGGTLGGIGTVTGTVTVDGTIAPGNSIGTLAIVGAYTQAAGSTYRVEISPAPASDLINITGGATLLGGTVNVIAAPGSYVAGQRYTILTASGGVTGAYAALTDNMPFLEFGLFYDPNNVFLDITQVLAASFASVAQTPNQKAAAGGAQQLGVGNPVFDTLLSLDAPSARGAFDLLSGEIHASLRGVLLDDSRFVRDGILQRLRQFGGASGVGGPQVVSAYADDDDGALAYAARKTSSRKSKVTAAIPAALVTKAEPKPEQRWAVWGNPFGNWGKLDGNGNAATATARTGGFVSGVDTTITGVYGGALRLGLAAAYQSQSMKVDDRNSSADIDSFHLAGYAALLNGPFALRAGLAHAWHAIETSRNVAFPGFSDSTRGDYDGHTTQVFGELGYALDYRRFALEPYAGLAYVRVKTDGFTETGGAAALTGLAADTATTFSTLGLRASVPLSTTWSAAVLKGGLGWRHAFNDVTPAAQLAFAGGTPFTIAGVPIARDALLVEAGLDAAWTSGITVGFAYSGQYAGSAAEHGIKGHAIRRF